MKRVIFSADDFGLDRAVNDAVEIAHRDGLLAAASLMVGEDAADEAVAIAHRYPGLRVGLHVALVEATPVSAPADIPDLVDATGRFPGDMVQAGFRFFFKPGIRAQLAREIRAQFEAFRRTGLALDHANTHKHIHLHPTVARLIVEIGREYGLRAVRLPIEPAGPVAVAEGHAAAGGLGAAALRAWTGQLKAMLKRHGVATNDQVFGLAWSGAMTEARVAALIPHLPDGITEIYFHPATSLSPKLARTMPTYRHADELAALLSPEVKRLVAVHGIERTSFTDIADGRPTQVAA
ncbi:MAG TPA: hopanoid biosynthesis-associated protein HpnK [Aliidongia sp.]|uniref:hopanoid biosynthesis-associated protein HpnK n=1 Tax=Aliidongia sp. TaxID=1914230 RepID=UPI002DDD9678|nr:hopanoid biosynthesis-associated protein HpnK [Aliidongia sp.]HEV2673840.1 hopanoid biosynthesis-associated protein HpnK [Aliidongia sp.]